MWGLVSCALSLGLTLSIASSFIIFAFLEMRFDMDSGMIISLFRFIFWIFTDCWKAAIIIGFRKLCNRCWVPSKTLSEFFWAFYDRHLWNIYSDVIHISFTEATILYHFSLEMFESSGFICFSKTSDGQFTFLWKFTTVIASSMWNIFSRRLFYPAISFVSFNFMVTLSEKSVYTWSRRDWGCSPISNIACNWPVVDCGRYRGKTRSDRISRSLGTFLSPILIVCTARSGSIFAEELFGEYLTC